MKSLFSNILILVLAMALPFKGTGQVSGIHVPLDGTENFRQVNEKTENYLKTIPDNENKERFQKHFARWAYYQSLHLGPAGEFVNISKKTYDAIAARGDAPLNTANGAWSFTGPSTCYIGNPNISGLGTGRIDRIAFHPTDAGTIYVGTPSGGLWKTTNGGTSWTPLSSYIPSLGISGIVVDYSDPATLYVLTGAGDDFNSPGGFVATSGYMRMSVGVLVSHDGGATWLPTGQLSANAYTGFRLVQHPVNPEILLAATSDGLYRTTNKGATWTMVEPGCVCDIEFKPGNPSIVYASGNGSFTYSTDGGIIWYANSTFDHALCADGRVEIAVTPASVNKVYLLASPATTGSAISGPATTYTNFCGFYVSTNSGLSFTRVTTSPDVFGESTGIADRDQSQYDIALAVKPTDNQIVVTGGIVLFKSINGGNSFSDCTLSSGSDDNYVHADCHALAYNPLNNYLYCATDGGFYRSTNDGESWTAIYDGISVTQFYHFDDYDDNPNCLMGGSQDNGTKYRTTNTSNFALISGGDGFDNAIDYTDETRGFLSENRSVLYFSDFTTAPYYTVIVNPHYFAQTEMNTSNPDILYISATYVMRYDNSTGYLTTPAGTGFLGQWVIRTCPSNSNRLYTAGGQLAFSTPGEMFMSSDGGYSYTTISGNPGFPQGSFPRISDICVRPNSSTQVYICFGGYTDGLKVLYSGDSGTSWSNISYDLPNIPFWSLEVDGSGNVYAGGDFGVYYHASGSTNWEPFYNGLPNVPVSDLAINEANDQLLAATFGRGIWKSSLRTSCPANVTINGNLSGTYFSSASNSITMNSSVTGGDGTSVVLRSGNYVTLANGFQAKGDPGSKFLATLGPCNSGMPPLAVAVQQTGPVYPAELSEYSMSLSRHDGTLEITTGNNGQKQVLLRLFKGGKARIILATAGGQFIRDVADFTGQKGKFTFDPGNSLAPGMYYLYLIVDGRVMHLQELSL